MEQVRVENSKSDYHEGLIEIYKTYKASNE